MRDVLVCFHDEVGMRVSRSRYTQGNEAATTVQVCERVGRQPPLYEPSEKGCLPAREAAQEACDLLRTCAWGEECTLSSDRLQSRSAMSEVSADVWCAW